MSGSYAFAMYTTSVEKLALVSHVVTVDAQTVVAHLKTIKLDDMAPCT